MKSKSILRQSVSVATALLALTLPTASARFPLGIEACTGETMCFGQETATTEDNSVNIRADAKSGDASCGDGALVYQNVVIGDGNTNCASGGVNQTIGVGSIARAIPAGGMA